MTKEAFDKLNIINNTIADTKYVLDDTKLCYGIKKVFLIWLSLFFVTNILLFSFWLISLQTSFFGTDLYFQIYRLMNILFPILCFSIYLLSSNKVSMTLKERDFLKGLTIPLLFISFFKMLNTLSYYINVEVMVLLYNTIPFELIFVCLVLFMFYRYFKDKKYLMLNIGILPFIFFFIYIKIYCFNMIKINMTIINLNNILDIMNLFSFLPIILLSLSLYFMKEKYYGKNNSRSIKNI